MWLLTSFCLPASGYGAPFSFSGTGSLPSFPVPLHQSQHNVSYGDLEIKEDSGFARSRGLSPGASFTLGEERARSPCLPVAAKPMDYEQTTPVQDTAASGAPGALASIFRTVHGCLSVVRFPDSVVPDWVCFGFLGAY